MAGADDRRARRHPARRPAGCDRHRPGRSRALVAGPRFPGTPVRAHADRGAAWMEGAARGRGRAAWPVREVHHRRAVCRRDSNDSYRRTARHPAQLGRAGRLARRRSRVHRPRRSVVRRQRRVSCLVRQPDRLHPARRSTDHPGPHRLRPRPRIRNLRAAGRRRHASRGIDGRRRARHVERQGGSAPGAWGPSPGGACRP